MTREPEHYGQTELLQSLELQNNPVVAIGFTGPEIWSGDITEIAIGSGRIAVNTADLELNKPQIRSSLLATLGLTNRDIGDRLFNTKNTVKTNMHVVLTTLNITHRAQIAPTYLNTGVFTLASEGDSLRLTNCEKEVVVGIVDGYNNMEIARRLGVSIDIPRQRLQSVRKRTGIRRRELMGLAALLSREVEC